MMRTLLILLLCVQSTQSVDTYVEKFFKPPMDATKPKGDTMKVKYLLKNSTGHKAGGPILYGIAGRETAETIRDRYTLFDNLIPQFENAVVVFVEQRFFGASKQKVASTLTDLAQLKMDNVVNDHITLIKSLNEDFGSKNFLVFGGGYGGVIAGYVANRFSQDDLSKDFNVLGWSSSPPTKMLRHVPLDDTQLKDFGVKLGELIRATDTDAHCPEAAIKNFANVFGKIRSLTSTTAAHQTLVDGLNLTPKPSIVRGAATPTQPTNDQLELIAFLRKKIIETAFEFPYDDTGALNTARRMQQLCAITKSLNTLDLVTKDALNMIFTAVGVPGTDLKWKVTNDGSNNVNEELLLAAYQDCTEYQIASCPAGTDTTTTDVNPLTGSQWSGTACTTIDNFDAEINAECKAIFDGLAGSNTFKTDQTVRLDPTKYPVTLAKNVITTISTQSLFSAGVDSNYGVADNGDFAKFWKLARTDQWEFYAPRDCDTDKVRDVRYLVLRAFGCLGSFVTGTDDKSDFCTNMNNLFTDNHEDFTDPDALPAQCNADKSSVGKFPYKGAQLKFIDTPPPASSGSTPSPQSDSSGSTVIPPQHQGSSVNPPRYSSGTTKTPDDSTQGVNGVASSLLTVLLSAMFVWVNTL